MEVSQLVAYSLILVLLIILVVFFYRLFFQATKLLDALAQYTLKAQQKAGDDKQKALRLQAYERLSLLMERMAVQNMLLRKSAGDLNASQYTASLLMTIREEFEHNVTQQVYVSDQLWSIILQARDNVSQLITRAAEGAEDGRQVANRLLHMSQNQPQNPIALAQSAIRREAASLQA